MRPSCKYLALPLLLFLCAAVAAETLTGTLKNGTTGKPAGGDEVVLLSLGQAGMEEAGRTKADAKGNFSFTLDAAGPHLVRAIHQGVTYHRMAPPGTTSVELEVFDVAKKIPEIGLTADVMRLQADGNTLQGIRLFAVNNTSNPPRTQMNDQNFEFYLPDGAVVDTGMAKTSGGQPITSAPVPEKEKNRYSFLFPLRPGETQFQVVFHVPYGGNATINPNPLYPAQHFVVMLPKAMQFSPVSASSGFQSMQDPQQSDATVQVVSNPQLGESLAFKISGTGTLQSDSGQETTASGQNRDSRPGGGLGPPIDAPDPLEKYHWYILGGFAVVLIGGALYVAKRSKAVAVPDFAASDAEAPVVPAASKPASKAPVAAPTNLAPASPKPGLLLEALKEELFQLELEHKQGHISQQEYDKAKAALDQTLERALKREAAKAT